ncbi:MAG: flagellar hook assembly protein FlgD [Betaproteobacteria bacterium]|nr:flagellar hook assembly protein FlgD [Betaproteobacteria bacterium]
MSVSSVATTSSADLISQLNGQTGSAKKSSDLESPFLTVLTAQMKNQDPLNPTDNAELTSQLAQISTVDGVNKMGKTMEGLSTLFTSSQNLQAASLVGHSVMAEGDTVSLAEGEAFGGVDLATAADRVTVTFYNANGEKVSTRDLGKLSAGYSDFLWEGADDLGNALPDGKYSYSVTAANNGKTVEATRYALTAVASVVTGAAGMQLQMADGSNRGLSQIQAFF